MENKSFDDIIKSKLSQFSIENDAQAWELFEQSSEDASFDQAIGDKIDAHQLDTPAGAWQSFASYRDNAEFDQQIQEKTVNYNNGSVPSDFNILSDQLLPESFDALIGAKLAEASMDVNSDWDSFEKILEGEEGFDENVKKKVEDYEVPFSDAQWPKLSEHLEKIERRRRRIIITKFIEAAVFILFILTIMQLYPIQNLTKKSVYRTHGVAQDLNRHSNDPANSVVTQENATIGSNQVVANNVADEKVVATNSDEQAGGLVEENLLASRVTGESVADSRELLGKVRALNTETLAYQLGQKKIRQNKAITLLSDIDKKQPSILNFERDKIRLNADKDEGRDFDKYQGTVVLASLDFQELEAEKRNFHIPFADLASQLKNGQYWFNIYGSPQANMINTPFDKSYSVDRAIDNENGVIEAYSHLAEGYSIGASISKESAAYEIEGGVEYTSLNYYPKQVTERVSNAAEGYKDVLLKEIIFDIIEFPINIKYNLFKKKGWKVYGTNGASVGVVAFANFDIEEKEFKPLATTIAGPNRNRNEVTFVDRKDFKNEGFVKTKNFLKNSYTTLSLGVGVSKEISDKISFYVQPTYYHNLSQSGIGPNNDVHHRLAMQIGTKVRI